MLDTIKTLSLLCGTSGRETKIREYIISRINAKCEWHEDALGNIIAFKKGQKPASHKVMLDAHMDEVGVIATSARSEVLILRCCLQDRLFLTPAQQVLWA